MTDLPYTYTDRDDDSIAVGVDHLVTTSGTVRTPTGADAAAFARAVLAAAGDTGHMVISRDELTAMRRADARSMRERAAEVAYHDLSTENATMADRIRALPLTPDGDTTEDQDAQLPDRGGDVIDDIEIALTRRDDLSDEHRVFYLSVLDRFEALTSERDRYRTAWASARRRARRQASLVRTIQRQKRAWINGTLAMEQQLADARRWGRILEEQRKDLRKKLSAETDRVAALRIAYQAAKDADLPKEDMVEPGDEVPALEHRVGALEEQYTDLADLVHGHGEDLTRLRRRYTAQDDG